MPSEHFRHPIDIMKGLLVVLEILAIITSSQSFFSQNHQLSTTRRYASQLKYADLTPAVDKFPRVPEILSSSSQYFITAKGPVPEGPDPFGLVAEDLQPLSDYVRELVVSENPVLTMAASHFFEKVSPYLEAFISDESVETREAVSTYHRGSSLKSNING